MNELPLSASLSPTAVRYETSLPCERAGDDDLALLVLPFRQIAAQDDLLRAEGQVGQRGGIDPGGSQAGEFRR